MRSLWNTWSQSAIVPDFSRENSHGKYEWDMKTGLKGTKCVRKHCYHVNKHTHWRTFTTFTPTKNDPDEENISLKCTVLARDRFYQILLEHLEAKLKVAELIITDTGHKRIIQKVLHQLLIQKLTFEHNKKNVSHIVTKRSAANITWWDP